jgi:2-haloacid dehalogenase
MTHKNNSTNYDWLLFDLDNTLLDFNASSEIAFHKSFRLSGIDSDPCDYDHYLELNEEAWAAYNENRMTHEEIKTYRFGKLFEKMNVDHIDPVIFNALYFEHLVINPILIEGAVKLVKALYGVVPMAIISNGMKEVQRPRLEYSGLLPFFDAVFISGELGFAKPQRAFFDHVHHSIGASIEKHKVLVIGDHLDMDIRGANDFGYISAWYNPSGSSKRDGIIPHFEIKNLNEIVHLLRG